MVSLCTSVRKAAALHKCYENCNMSLNIAFEQSGNIVDYSTWKIIEQKGGSSKYRLTDTGTRGSPRSLEQDLTLNKRKPLYR